MNVFDPKDLNEDEIVMYETAAVQTVTPAKYVMDLLRRLHGLRAAVHARALRDAEGAVLDGRRSKTEKDGSKAPSKASTVEAEKFEVGDNVRILRGVHKDRIGVVKMKDTSSFAYVCLEGNVLNYAFAWADLTKLPKFKINDRVVVRRTGVTGKVVHIGPRGLDVSFTTRGGGCYQESELEHTLKFKLGDKVRVARGTSPWYGKVGTVRHRNLLGQLEVQFLGDLGFAQRFESGDLELACKFAVGDRVRSSKTACHGTVVALRYGPEQPEIVTVNFGAAGMVSEYASDLDPAPPASKFAVGDRVTVTCGSEIGKSGVVESAEYGDGYVAVMVRGILHPILGYRKPDTLHHLPVEWLALTPSVEPPKPKPIEVTAFCRQVAQGPGVWGSQVNAVFDIVSLATDSPSTISGTLTLHAPMEQCPYLLSAQTKRTPFKLRLEEK